MNLLKLVPLALALVACTPQPAPKTSVTPEAVDGWREYPLRDGVVSMQPAKWKSETINIPLPVGAELEYKLDMKKGQTILYSIAYDGAAQDSDLTVEFHGHTEQVDGVGDLMFYSKTGAKTEHGVFTAPWDGVHGWYLKNNGAKDIAAKLDVAGYYEKLE